MSYTQRSATNELPIYQRTNIPATDRRLVQTGNQWSHPAPFSPPSNGQSLDMRHRLPLVHVTGSMCTHRHFCCTEMGIKPALADALHRRFWCLRSLDRMVSSGTWLVDVGPFVDLASSSSLSYSAPLRLVSSAIPILVS